MFSIQHKRADRGRHACQRGRHRQSRGIYDIRPKTTIVVCGYNKIVKNLDAAIDRIRNYAAPVNHKRLNAKVPCLEGSDCDVCPVPFAA